MSLIVFLCEDGFNNELPDLRIFPKYTLRIPYNKKTKQQKPNQPKSICSLTER